MPLLIQISAVLALLSTVLAFVIRQRPRLFWPKLDPLTLNSRSSFATMMLVIFAFICAVLSTGTAFLLWQTMPLSIQIVSVIPAAVLLLWGALRVKW